MSFSVELIWLPRYVKLSTAFILTSDNVLIEPCWLEFIVSVKKYPFFIEVLVGITLKTSVIPL